MRKGARPKPRRHRPLKTGYPSKTCHPILLISHPRASGDLTKRHASSIPVNGAAVGNSFVGTPHRCVGPVHPYLSAIRLQAVEIRRYLAPQREALSELYRTRGILSEDVAYDLRYQTDRIIHHVEDLDLAKERAVVLQGELQNRLAEKQNARMFVLSIVAAIFLPLSFLTGVFGMNVAGLPGLEHPNAFNILTGSMLVLAIALIAYMRWKKWM
jgi:hypothetical protein